MDLAAANWAASAALLAREIGDCLFVDMGSTTTDLIPIRGKALAAKTDFLRLAAGDLVYMGMLRTRLDALLPQARIGGQRVLLAPEFFAIMADARLALGQIYEVHFLAIRRTERERTARLRYAGWRAQSVPTWRRLARPEPWLSPSRPASSRR